MIGETISHYRLLSLIGEGGMGVVYVAEDMHLGRRVAVKFPLTGADEKHYRARFLREARAAGCETVGGLGMLVAQAEGQFRLWTGRAAPPGVMQAAAEKRLFGREG